MSDDVPQRNFQQRRYVPGTDAEFNAQVTQPQWSNAQQSPGLDAKLTKKFYLVDHDGNRIQRDGQDVAVDDHLLTIYELFTQDIRLGNLDPAELEFCRLHIDLAHDLLSSGYNRGASVVMERAISVIETSHSKKGWFRRLLGTLRNENYSEVHEPTKGFFTGKRKD